MQWFTALSRLTISDVSLLLFFLTLSLSLSRFFFLCIQGAFRIRTLFMVGLPIGTKLTAVSLNRLLVVAICKSRQC